MNEPNEERPAGAPIVTDKGETAYLIPGAIFDTVGRPGIVYRVRSDGSHKRLTRRMTGAERRRAKREANSTKQ